MTVVLLVSVAAALAVAVILYLNRAQRVTINAGLPAVFPADGFSHEIFDALLTEYVDADGRVDYGRWHASPEAVSNLDAYLAAVASFSPPRTPGRFPDPDSELAYWLNAYNAWVIRSVIDHWPLTTVTAVKAPVEWVRGLGFFHRQRFCFGGDYLSLLHVENRIIRRRHRDPRIHFVLSCASGSCPGLRTDLPDGRRLQRQLAEAAADFVSDPANVEIDHDRRQVRLSRIFKWYRNDFMADVRARGLPVAGGLLAYLRTVAPPGLAADIERASGYEIVFRDYDWSLNSTER